MADTVDSKSTAAMCAGSSPAIGTIFRRHNGDISHLTLVKSIPIYRGVFLFAFLPSVIARFLIATQQIVDSHAYYLIFRH